MVYLFCADDAVRAPVPQKMSTCVRVLRRRSYVLLAAVRGHKFEGQDSVLRGVYVGHAGRIRPPLMAPTAAALLLCCSPVFRDRRRGDSVLVKKSKFWF